MNHKIIDITTHPKYKDYTTNDWIMHFIEYYGQCDGGHHKQWTLDQIVRIIKGTPIIIKQYDHFKNETIDTGEPSQKYLDWVEERLGAKIGNGDYEYGYDEGIAP